MRRLSTLLASALTLATISPVFLQAPALAQALPAPYSGSAHADLIGADVSLTGASVVGLKVGHALSTADSTATPASVAESANLDAAVGGFPVPVDKQTATAPPKQDPAPDTLLPVNVAPLINLGAVSRDTLADFGSAISCPSAAATQTLSDAVTNLAATSVASLPAPLSLTVAQVGASTIHTNTSLVENGANPGHWDVDSRVTTQLGDVSLLGGAAIVHVTSPVTTFAHSDGTTGTAGFVNPPTVTVNLGGTTIPIPLNGTPVNIPIAIPGVNLVSVNVTAFSPVDKSTGAVGEADLQALVKIDVLLGAIAPGDLAQVHLALAPQHVIATDPAGGVQCTAIAAAPVITAPANGSSTSNQTPTISGTATYGSASDPGTVTVKDGTGKTVCTATVQPGGTWSCTPATPLPAGTYTITAVETSSTATSPPSAPVTFTVVDTTPPLAPVIAAPANGSTTTSTTPPISGTAEPGSTVTVTVDGAPITCANAPVVADVNGNWTCTPATPLGQGQHTATATATDAANNTSPASAPVTFTVDSIAPAAPAITSPANGSSTNNTTPTISGTGEFGVTVTVTVDGSPIACANAPVVVDNTGHWSCTPTTPLTEGQHTATATQTDGAGNVSPASNQVGFTVDTTAPAATAITGPANGATTGDTTPTITGTGEPGATVTVTVDGSPIACANAPVVVNSTGHWSCTPTTPLADGQHTATATQTDPSGNTAPASTQVTFTVNSDLDGDGLSNSLEQQIGTNPNNPDTDGDGLTDGQEYNGFSIGVCGRASATLKTNPLKADTDGDGLTDGAEAKGSLNRYGDLATNPLKPDTDGEGLKDGAEVKGFNLNLTVTKPTGKVLIGLIKTNPCKADTDGDGLTDFREKVGTKVYQKVILPKRKVIYLTLLRSNPIAKDTDADRLGDKAEVTGSANVKFNRAKTDPAYYDTDRGGQWDGVEIEKGSNPADALSTPTHPMGRMSLRVTDLG